MSTVNQEVNVVSTKPTLESFVKLDRQFENQVVKTEAMRKLVIDSFVAITGLKPTFEELRALCAKWEEVLAKREPNLTKDAKYKRWSRYLNGAKEMHGFVIPKATSKDAIRKAETRKAKANKYAGMDMTALDNAMKSAVEKDDNDAIMAIVKQKKEVKRLADKAIKDKYATEIKTFKDSLKDLDVVSVRYLKACILQRKAITSFLVSLANDTNDNKLTNLVNQLL